MDSQAAIKALKNVFVKSKTVDRCREELSNIYAGFQDTVTWKGTKKQTY